MIHVKEPVKTTSTSTMPADRARYVFSGFSTLMSSAAATACRNSSVVAITGGSVDPVVYLVIVKSNSPSKISSTSVGHFGRSVVAGMMGSVGSIWITGVALAL